MRLIKYLLPVLVAVTGAAHADEVKLSRSGICHDVSSPSYKQTKHYKSYETLEECLKHGRLARGQAKPNKSQSNHTHETVNNGPVPKYDRELYNHWIDSTGNGLNTRHELLAEMSVALVTYNDNKTRVLRGRWNDPYSGKTFYNSKDLDVDHIVPLGYAHVRGAYKMSKDQKERFANDKVNLLPVQASLNREKGAKGPTQWMPPNHPYRCQYLARFHRVMKTYRLEYFPSEKRTMTRMLNACDIRV